MDPQMVWDMMDECEAETENHTTYCSSTEPESDTASYAEKPQTTPTRGWMGFPVYGLNR